MTIGGWVLLILIGVTVIGFAAVLFVNASNAKGRIVVVVIAVALIAASAWGLHWYFHSTASGQRALIDQRSELGGGLARTITVYTANGDVIARFSGMIDIEANKGGYIKFDFEGKRYIYYNCFVETVAEIG